MLLYCGYGPRAAVAARLSLFVVNNNNSNYTFACVEVVAVDRMQHREQLRFALFAKSLNVWMCECVLRLIGHRLCGLLIITFFFFNFNRHAIVKSYGFFSFEFTLTQHAAYNSPKTRNSSATNTCNRSQIARLLGKLCTSLAMRKYSNLFEMRCVCVCCVCEWKSCLLPHLWLIV